MTDQERIKAGQGIFNYKGILIEKLVGGYRLFGTTCNTEEEVLEIIQNATSSLSESIVVLDKGNWGVSNGEEK